MYLGMPTVAVASTAAPSAVPAGAGVVSADIAVLVDAVRRFVADPALAAEFGKRAREYALENFALSTFLSSWDVLLTESRNDEVG